MTQRLNAGCFDRINVLVESVINCDAELSYKIKHGVELDRVLQIVKERIEALLDRDLTEDEEQSIIL